MSFWKQEPPKPTEAFEELGADAGVPADGRGDLKWQGGGGGGRRSELGQARVSGLQQQLHFCCRYQHYHFRYCSCCRFRRGRKGGDEGEEEVVNPCQAGAASSTAFCTRDL